jgi:predicted site-specific integrase-resolvase
MKLSQYAKIVGVSYKTAWTWYRNGEISGYQTPTGTIIVTELDQKYLQGEDTKTVVYARVSSNKQKDDLERQIVRVQDFCAANGWRIDQVVKEIASGVNDERPKLIKILTDQSVQRIVVEHKDRLTRVGYNYIDVLLQQRGGELVVINLADTDNEDLLQDLASIIYSFCARLYGKRRAKHKADLITKTLEAE